jgi:hypothetical protein
MGNGKQKIMKVIHTDWGLYEFDGKVSELIPKLQKLISDNSDLFDIEIDMDKYGDEIDVVVRGYRWETDEEQSDRIQKEDIKRKENIRINIQRVEETIRKEKALYEQLKQKYGDK